MISLRLALFFVVLCVPTFAQTCVRARLMLEGPFHPETKTMQHDYVLPGGAAWRSSILPHTDPFGLGVTVDSIPQDAIDWILLEFRRQPVPPALVRVAAFLREDGVIVGANGQDLLLEEKLLPHGNYFIVVRPPGHLAVMSAISVPLSGNSDLYDFSRDSTQAYMSTLSPMKNDATTGMFLLYAGDVNGDGKINAIDTSLVRSQTNKSGYNAEDQNFDGIVNATDRILVRAMSASLAFPDFLLMDVPSGVPPRCSSLVILSSSTDEIVIHVPDRWKECTVELMTLQGKRMISAHILCLGGRASIGLVPLVKGIYILACYDQTNRLLGTLWCVL